MAHNKQMALILFFQQLLQQAAVLVRPVMLSVALGVLVAVQPTLALVAVELLVQFKATMVV